MDDQVTFYIIKHIIKESDATPAWLKQFMDSASTRTLTNLFIRKDFENGKLSSTVYI